MTHRPEILAPAGDLASLETALAHGADSVYLGLDQGFNARARADNFSAERLPDTAALVHRAGARLYLTLNTLVFEPELEAVEELIRVAGSSGVDALIVQDPAVALIARELCPELEVHASTQMTISSPEAARFAEMLGATRVVLPRELSVDEIRAFTEKTAIETEVFIHGALCVAWSGQCLTSEAWGQRSANRGQCAQSCRMPYDLVVDGERRDLGDVEYLLSPKDLAGVRAVPELMKLGVHGLKIEGRQKGPTYVGTAVAGYRRWVDALANDAPDAEAQLRDDLRSMSLAYTRGFSDGFLAGSDHQTLVEGRFPKHRGVCIGRVTSVEGRKVWVERADDARPWTGALATDERPQAPAGTVGSPLPGLGGADDAASGARASDVEPRAGMGVVFDAGDPEDKEEPGGPLFSVEATPNGWTLAFGDPGPDLARVEKGQRVWITSDPSVVQSVRATTRGGALGRIPLDLRVEGAQGAPLRVVGTAGSFEAVVTGNVDVGAARTGGLDADLLRSKLGAVGGTPFHLRSLDVDGLDSGLFVPVSELKAIRRELIARLDAQVAAGPVRSVRADSVLDTLHRPARTVDSSPPTEAAPLLIPLCRTDEQLQAVIDSGLGAVELDWMEWVGLGTAVKRARDAGLHVTVATLRVQKPDEESYDRRADALKPDAVLVRHWGGVMHFANREGDGGPTVHGDFSLNVTNSITANLLLDELGLESLTASFDLDETQLLAMLDHVPAERMTIMLHHRIPTFHTEHCVYSHLLSNGRDYRTCGRPCESQEVGLRDHVGRTHPVIVDAGCRNTVFNADAQTTAPLVPALLERGVRRFRVELVRESGDETRALLAAYSDLLAGRLTAEKLEAALGVRAQTGVSHGRMELIV